MKHFKDYGFNTEPPCKIGDKIHVYEIYGNEIYYYSDMVEFLGADCAFTDNGTLTEAGRRHYYNELGKEWFLTEEACHQAAEEKLKELQEDVA